MKIFVFVLSFRSNILYIVTALINKIEIFDLRHKIRRLRKEVTIRDLRSQLFLTPNPTPTPKNFFAAAPIKIYLSIQNEDDMLLLLLYQHWHTHPPRVWEFERERGLGGGAAWRFADDDSVGKRFLKSIRRKQLYRLNVVSFCFSFHFFSWFEKKSLFFFFRFLVVFRGMYALRRKAPRRKYFLATEGASKVRVRAKWVDLFMLNKRV